MTKSGLGGRTDLPGNDVLELGPEARAASLFRVLEGSGPFVLADESGNVVYANPASARVLDGGASPVVGRPVEEIASECGLAGCLLRAHPFLGGSLLVEEPKGRGAVEWDCFRGFADGSVQGMVVQRGEKVLFANATFARMLGHDGPAEIGALDALAAFVGPEPMPGAPPFYDAVMRGEPVPNPVEAQLRRKDGTLLWVECIHGRVDWFGAPAVLVTAVDISERKRTEADLRRAYAEIAELKERLQAENAYLRQEITARFNFAEIIGTSAALREVLRKVERVARTTTSVLILGETGTGKELLARAVHRASQRAERPFIGLNCAAMPEALVESELFGHERGAFTGATGPRRGRFELADGGTLFLDEVGELPAAAQAKLLRVLQLGELERVGGSTTVKVDVRIVAATNRDLRAMVSEGKFREDLFYRLSVFPLLSPPLRERRDDIPLLAQHFLRRHGERLGKQFKGLARGALDELREYAWPGNIRELENVIERAVILSDGPLLEVADDAVHAVPRPSSAPTTDATIGEVERRMIERAVEACKGRIEGRNGAAARLGIAPSTLRGRIRQLGIERITLRGK